MNGCSQEAKAMTGECSSKPEPRRPTWQPEFIEALTERVREKWPERIKLAENAIFDRIDALEESSARIEDLNERWGHVM
jgi:hypothetical protein